MKSILVMVSLALLLTISGCIGMDSKGTAHQLQEARAAVVQDGLLTPITPAQREAYRNTLLGFRSNIQSTGGNDGAALAAYLDGSLSLLSMQDVSQDGLALLENIDPSFVACDAGGPASQAIGDFQDAKKFAQQANDSFVHVQQNATIANELGADYVVNVVQTTSVLVSVNADRVDQLKSACGFSV